MISSNVHQNEVDFSSSTSEKNPKQHHYLVMNMIAVTEETSKETYKTIAEIASNCWSPLKYQLRANMNDVSDRLKKESSGS